MPKPTVIKAKGLTYLLISKLEGLRGEKAWTQEELAARLCVGTDTYKKWLSGKTKDPPLKLLINTMKVYKIPEAKLCEAIRQLIKEAA